MFTVTVFVAFSSMVELLLVDSDNNIPSGTMRMSSMAAYVLDVWANVIMDPWFRVKLYVF